jgi:hypothetical protein
VVPITDSRVDADLLLEPNDFVVNTTYVGSQDLAFRLDGGGRQLAVGADGVFTIGWSDTCQMVGRCDVFGRRFDATGSAVDHRDRRRRAASSTSTRPTARPGTSRRW